MAEQSLSEVALGCFVTWLACMFLKGCCVLCCEMCEMCLGDEDVETRGNRKPSLESLEDGRIQGAGGGQGQATSTPQRAEDSDDSSEDSSEDSWVVQSQQQPPHVVVTIEPESGTSTSVVDAGNRTEPREDANPPLYEHPPTYLESFLLKP